MFSLLSLFLLLFGLFVGTLGTMLGVGGGWLHVPFLMLLFNFSAQKAIGTSIGIIFFNTLAGSIIYYFKKQMDVYLAKKLSLAIIPGAIIGPFLAQKFTTDFFYILFSFVLILISFYLFFKDRGIAILPEKYYSKECVAKEGDETVTYQTSMELGIIGTLVIGFFSNLVGIGGGIIHVPYLIVFMRIPTHVALGTSHFILCASSCIGLIVNIYLGNVVLDYMMPITLGTIIGARIGAEMSAHMDGFVIRRLISAVMLIVAIKMFSTGL